MLKLKFQYFGHLMRRTNTLDKTLRLEKIEGKRRRRWQRMRWLDGITDLMDMNLSKLWEIVKDRGDWCAAVHGVRHNLATEQQQHVCQIKHSSELLGQACFSTSMGTACSAPWACGPAAIVDRDRGGKTVAVGGACR